MRTLITLVLIATCFYASAQSGSITKYYDSSWRDSRKENAYYFAKFEKEDTLYKVTSYRVSSGSVAGKSTWADTNFRKAVGLSLSFYENGGTEDSTYYFNDGNIKDKYHYFKTGKLNYHAFFDKVSNELKGENYDDKGNKIPGYFTYQKPAMFPGGSGGWIEYLTTHLRTKVPIKNKAPAGKYTVKVEFLVDKKGLISEVAAINDPGYGTAEEAVRVIKTGPSWIPAMQNGKNVIYRQIQSITFMVEDSK